VANACQQHDRSEPEAPGAGLAHTIDARLEPQQRIGHQHAGAHADAPDAAHEVVVACQLLPWNWPLVRRLHAFLDQQPSLRVWLPLVYAAIAGLDYSTIAEMLDLPLGTVKTHVFRAKRLLKAAIMERLDVTRAR
jgi:hypothetical protein